MPHTEHVHPIFSMDSVSKSYAMGEVTVHALREVTLEILEGELLVILGASGSGKSTLMNILGGLDTPTSGRVSYRGRDLTDADDEVLTQFRRSSVGFVFQFYNLVPSLTAMENVQLVTDICANSMKPTDALELVGLHDRLHHFPSQLSGGEQQRVAIARAIAKKPDVLLCDEPTGALDYTTGVLVLDVLEQVHRELNTTVALITHNASIADMADRVIRMQSGAIQREYCNVIRVSPRDIVW